MDRFDQHVAVVGQCSVGGADVFLFGQEEEFTHRESDCLNQGDGEKDAWV